MALMLVERHRVDGDPEAIARTRRRLAGLDRKFARWDRRSRYLDYPPPQEAELLEWKGVHHQAGRLTGLDVARCTGRNHQFRDERAGRGNRHDRRSRHNELPGAAVDPRDGSGHRGLQYDHRLGLLFGECLIESCLCRTQLRRFR